MNVWQFIILFGLAKVGLGSCKNLFVFPSQLTEMPKNTKNVNIPVYHLNIFNSTRASERKSVYVNVNLVGFVCSGLCSPNRDGAKSIWVAYILFFGYGTYAYPADKGLLWFQRKYVLPFPRLRAAGCFLLCFLAPCTDVLKWCTGVDILSKSFTLLLPISAAKLCSFSKQGDWNSHCFEQVDRVLYMKSTPRSYVTWNISLIGNSYGLCTWCDGWQGVLDVVHC